MRFFLGLGLAFYYLQIRYLKSYVKERGKPGLNFINILRNALTHPKSVKRFWRLDWVLTLWEATGVKAARKNVDEIDPRSRFHQHLSRADPKTIKTTYNFTVFFTLLGSPHIKVAPHKMLMKLTPVFWKCLVFTNCQRHLKTGLRRHQSVKTFLVIVSWPSESETIALKSNKICWIKMKGHP